MPYQVQVGAQVVEFPDSVNPEEAQRILADQFPPTGEDVAQALQNPDFVPTREQFDLFKEYNKNKQTDWINTIAQSVDAAAGMIGSALAEGATGAAVNPLNYIEGAAQGTRQLYGLVAQSENPDSPLFKFKDLVTGTGTPDSQYNQFLEARDFAKLSRQLESGQTAITAPPELTNPEFVQGVSLIADPTMLLPGIGEVFGAGKLSARAVGKGAQLAGRAVTAVAAPAERLLSAAERGVAEALSVSPEALRTTAATTGIAGALGIAPELATAAAIPAAVRTTREIGEAITAAGENLMTQPSRVGPLEAIGAAPGANLRQRMLGVIGQYGGDAAVDAALRGTAGALEGAALGAGLGYLSGGEEGAAAGIGSGGLQGAVGALGGRAYQKLTGKAAAEARAGDLGRFIEGLQDPTTKSLFERVRNTHGVDAASALMDVEALTKGRFGDVDVLYRSNKDFADQFGGSARGVQLVQAERPTIVINADIIGKGKGDSPLYTLGHELFHALEKSEQLSAGANDIKDALVGRWSTQDGVPTRIQEGAFSDAEIEARFNEYRDKLAAGNAKAADDLAQYDTLPKKANFIASELAAEHFARLMAGQKPDTMLRGFSGLARQTLDAALTQNASKAIANAAAVIERTFGVKPTDSVLFPDLKQASPQINAMLRDLVRARRSLDQKIELQGDQGIATLKPSDISNPVAAQQVIDLGLGERLPDGTVRAFSNEEIRVREERDTGEIRRILESVPGARIVDGEILGRFSPEQLSAIEQSQAVSGRMKDKVRAINSAMGNGNSVFVNYGAATRRVKNRLTGKFTSNYSSGIRLSQREVLPYSFYISKADNPVVKVIDITKMRNALDKVANPDGSVAGLWSNVDGFMSDLAKYFTNLDAKENARRSSEVFGQDKARFLGDFVNEQEKGGRKFVRDLRVDRIGSIDPRSFRANISEDAIQLSKLRWMPAETIGDKSVINSDEGYRIVSGAKHRLYGPDGKLIGIYDTQTQAERKADATQTRLQPEVDQQQRVPGNEGRQTAEAGGGNRALGGQEGRQADRTVRQAGDVVIAPDSETFTIPKADIGRFMPASDKVKLEDYADRKIIALAADRMGIGEMAVGPTGAKRKLSVLGQGGRGFMNIFNGGGWAFSDQATADRFISRLKKDADPNGNVIVGITVQSPINHLKNQTGQLAYIEAMQAAIDSKTITKRAANSQIAAMSSAIVNSTAKSIKQSARDKFSKINSLADLKAAVQNKQLNFADMEPLLTQMQRKALPITAKELTAAGISPADIARDIADPELADVPFGSVVALLGVNVKQAPEKTGFHYSYPWTIHGETIGYLDKFYNISDLSTEKRIRNAQGIVTAQPLQTVMPVMDNIINTIKTKQGIPSVPSERFMPSDTDYLSAVKAGDTAAAQRMVGQAAKAAGYLDASELSGPKYNEGDPVYHNTPSKFTVFEPGKNGLIQFTPSKTLFGKRGDIKVAAYLKEPVIRNSTGLILSVKDPSQVKLADPITRDDQGNIIPLSQRFQTSSADIRFMPAGSQNVPKHYESVDSFREHWNALGVRNMTDIRAKGTPYEHIRPSEIEVEKANRNKGLGTAFMQDLVSFADLTGKQIRINPSDELGATSKSRLEKFYKRFGFVENKPGKNKDYSISERFYRQPSSGQRFMPAEIQRDIGRNQDFATPPTDSEAIDALSSEKKAKFGAARSIKPGTQVAARIDIPAFLRTGKYVVAVHEPDGAAGGPGKVIGYDTVTRLQNPKFVVKPGVQRIYEGKSAKFPVATVDGKIMADRSIPDDLENYVPVGMDPKEHAYFYDKRTDQPVIGGSESVSVGNTVFVKNPVYGDPSQFAFMPSPDSSMPGAYSFTGGYRALPGKSKGSLRIYSPAGSLIGIASSLDEAQRIIRKKAKQ
jgi:GNAT superfamily N-acetyltransferase